MSERSTNQHASSTKGMSTLVRPKFGPGMLLQHDDLEQLNIYTRELNRLMFRSLFGCGVVCGLVVEPTRSAARVRHGRRGLALDCHGDPIYVPKDTRVAVDENCDPNLNDARCGSCCAAPRSAARRARRCARPTTRRRRR